jgi:ABC-type bacteriocin/lantibiotic exporter with double-glycine peptidase domain
LTVAAPRPPKLNAQHVALTHINQRTRQLLEVLRDIDLTVSDSELVTIVGPSGCGKTTFLNAVDGLLPLTSGRIEVDGRAVAGPGPDRARTGPSYSSTTACFHGAPSPATSATASSCKADLARQRSRSAPAP